MQQIRPRTNDEIHKDIQSLLGKLGTLQTESVVRYELIKNPDQTEESIRYVMNRLRSSGGAFFSEYSMMPYPGRKIEGDMAIAFWAFTDYAKEAGDRFLAADWPSSIIFRTEMEKRSFRITVCHSPAGDDNLNVLKNKRWDGKFHEIIVGVNMTVDEIDHSMFPDSLSVRFVSFMADTPLIDIPKMQTSLIKEEEA